WHPDRHANDPEVARKAQEKLADINAAYETIRRAKFPSRVAEPAPAAKPKREPKPRPEPAPPSIEFAPRRRLRYWVLLVIGAVLGIQIYRGMTHGPRDDGPTMSIGVGATFGLGSTSDEVRAAQGEPDTILDGLHMWKYGFANVEFDHDRVVG